MSSPGPPILQRLHRLERSPPVFHDQLCNVLYGEEYQQCVLNLQADDSAWLVEYLDAALDGLDPPSAAFRKCLRELRRVCGTAGILPTSYTLSSQILDICPNPFASGGYGDVYEGTLDSSKVCIKRVRAYSKDGPQNTTKAFCREAAMWKHLKHRNVLTLLGVTIIPLQLISNWMPGGDLSEYIKKHPGAERLGLLSDIAMGLRYLHSCNVVHGDLKGPNILIDGLGHALITDFGLTKVTQSLDSIRSASRHGNTPRWSAPEVLIEGLHSKEADMFSFAMVIIEIFTGAVPFNELASPAAMYAIMQGGRPLRPTHPTFTKDLWTLVQRCWDKAPHLRPEASEALQVLKTLERPAWKRLIGRTLATYERISLITRIFSDSDEVEMVGHLSGNDAQVFINVVAETLDDLTPKTRRQCLHYLYVICDRHALLPTSTGIPICYNPTEDPLHHGGLVDVWKGRYQGQDVAAKVLYLRSKGDPMEIRKRFCREVVVWRALRHPNVLPLLGVTITEDRLVMVSEWMVKGNITEFVKVDVNADRLGLLGDVTQGLMYMHVLGIVHGGLKGTNILIDHDGHARLAGFSLLTTTSDQPVTTPVVTGDAIRWMSPELISPNKFNMKEGRQTKESDCYALGMVIYEVLSGQAPFAPREGLAIVSRVVEGERPARPHGEEGLRFTADLWEMLGLCWKPQPGDRPGLDVVLGCLRGCGKQGGSKEGWFTKFVRNTSKVFKVKKTRGP